jgi:hypothetical protein
VIDCVVGGIRAGFHVFDALGTRCPAAAGHHDVAHLDHIGPIGDPDVVEAARILVRADPPGRTVRVNITMPEDLLAAVDRFAVRTGYSRSGLLAQAVCERPRRDQSAA